MVLVSLAAIAVRSRTWVISCLTTRTFTPWAISTMATVGFGDLVPKTDLGRAIASVMMLLGWGVLAVPTGIVTAEMARRPFDDEGGAAALPLASRGVLAMTALAPDAADAPAVPRKRITPAARRRALGQHRRGAR